MDRGTASSSTSTVLIAGPQTQPACGGSCCDGVCKTGLTPAEDQCCATFARMFLTWALTQSLNPHTNPNLTLTWNLNLMFISVRLPLDIVGAAVRLAVFLELLLFTSTVMLTCPLHISSTNLAPAFMMLASTVKASVYAGPYCLAGGSDYCCPDNVCMEDLNGSNAGHACCAQSMLTPVMLVCAAMITVHGNMGHVAQLLLARGVSSCHASARVLAASSTLVPIAAPAGHSTSTVCGHRERL